MFDDEIMRVVTNELTGRSMENKNEGESSWSDAHVLTNNNQDRIVINHVGGSFFAGRSNQLFVTWLKETSTKNQIW